MPIYESEEITRDELEKIRRKGKCKECGAPLNMYLDPESGKAFVACWDWPRSHHEGIEREASRYEKEGVASLNIKTREEIMVEEHGEEKTKVLAKYIGGGVITKRIATEIVETLWGRAPHIEKTKAILLCQTYQLNPLMKHIYLIGYKRWKDRKPVLDDNGNQVIDWSIQIGIGATRLMAQRKHNFSYLDMTPRKATEDEIRKILGDTADKDSIYGFVHIKDMGTGAEAFGLRGIKKDESIKGVDKGNTHLNQACVRAERLALDRQYPGEMPPNVEVVDERYIEGEYKVVDRGTGEITEHIDEESEAAAARQVLKNGGELKIGTYLGKIDGQPLYYGLDAAGNPIAGEKEAAKSPADEQAEHWCQEHNCAFVLKKSRYGQFYSHKLPGGGYCKESDQLKKKKEAAPAPAAEADAGHTEAEPAPVEDPEAEIKRDPDTIKTLNDLYKACHEDFNLQPDQVIKELGVSSQTDISDTPSDCYRQIAKVR